MKTFNIMENINSLVKKIISYSSTDRKALCIQLFSDWDLFETFSGTLTEANALDLIKRSLYQHEVAVILPNILQFSDEVFSNLFDCVCKHDCFTDKDMLQLLERNCDTTRAGIKYCIDYAKTEYGDSKKLAVASEWLEQSTSKSHKNGKNF